MRHGHKLFVFFLILASCVAGVYFRSYPRHMTILDEAATHAVYDSSILELKEKLCQQYPNGSVCRTPGVPQPIFHAYLKDNKKEINVQVARKAQEFKARFQDDNGRTYINGIDSYYFYRLVQNILTRGRASSDIDNGFIHDDLVMETPIDPTSTKNIHLTLGVLFYRVVHFFSKDTPLSEVLFYVPIFLSLIVAVFSFVTAKKLGADDLGAFFASATINLSPFFLERSIGEWFDTDIYNVLFPLLIFGTFLFAFNCRKKIVCFLLSALSGLFLAFYASTWKGWWFIFDFILLGAGLFILNEKLCQEDSLVPDEVFRDQGIATGLFFALGSLLVIGMNGFTTWKDCFAEPMHLATILKVTSQTVWPNVYLTVAELNAVEPSGIVSMVGGPFFFFFTLLGMIYILFVQKGGRDVQFGGGLLILVFWILGTFYASTTALRFVLLMVVPLGLAFGLSMTKLFEGIDARWNKTQKAAKVPMASTVRLAVTGFFSLMLFYQMMLIYPRIKDTLPGMTDPMYRTLETIKKDTPEDSIINSWWDYGHWFKAIAQRRVLFDGMTQNTPTAYWIANVLLSQNEEEAAGILRMINTCDNKAIDLLERYGYSTPAAVGLVKKVVALSPEEALKSLKEAFPLQKAQELFSLLFPGKIPPVYFIVSPDMITKVGPISFIGNWNFDKVDMWLRKKKMSRTDFLTYLIKKYNMTLEQAESNYLEMSLLSDKDYKKWFSLPRGFFSEVSKAKKDGRMLFFDTNGLVVDLDNLHARLMSEFADRRGVPSTFFLFQDGQYKEGPSQEPGLFVSALVYKTGNDYRSLLLDRALAKSMLVRLYFLKGEGLKYFKLWHQEVDEGGSVIYVYKLHWPLGDIKESVSEGAGIKDPVTTKVPKNAKKK